MPQAGGNVQLMALKLNDGRRTSRRIWRPLSPLLSAGAEARQKDDKFIRRPRRAKRIAFFQTLPQTFGNTLQQAIAVFAGAESINNDF